MSDHVPTEIALDRFKARMSEREETSLPDFWPMPQPGWLLVEPVKATVSRGGVHLAQSKELDGSQLCRVLADGGLRSEPPMAMLRRTPYAINDHVLVMSTSLAEFTLGSRRVCFVQEHDIVARMHEVLPGAMQKFNETGEVPLTLSIAEQPFNPPPPLVPESSIVRNLR